MKKLLIICVGKESFNNLGIETQALDSKGVGTGLPNVIIQDEIEIVPASDIKELATIIKNDLHEDRDRIVVMGDSSVLPPIEQHRLNDVKSNIIQLIEVPTDSVKNTVEQIVAKSSELSNIETEISNEEFNTENNEGYIESIFSKLF